MKMSELIDQNALYRIEQVKAGYYDKGIPKLFSSLGISVDDVMLGKHTKGVMIEVLTKVAEQPDLAKQVTGTTHVDPSELIKLLVDEVQTDSLTAVSKLILKEVFCSLQVNTKLAKRALSINSSGRPPDPVKRKAAIRLAILVLYYKEEAVTLNDSYYKSGAYVKAAAHANKIDDPSDIDAQVRAARFAWDNHQETARRVWKGICEEYAQHGATPVPKDDYPIKHRHDEDPF